MIEHGRLEEAKRRDATQALGEFLHEFLPSKGLRIVDFSDMPAHDLDGLMFEFFQIDRKRLEAEKRALLATIAKGQRW